MSLRYILSLLNVPYTLVGGCLTPQRPAAATPQQAKACWTYCLIIVPVAADRGHSSGPFGGFFGTARFEFVGAAAV